MLAIAASSSLLFWSNPTAAVAVAFGVGAFEEEALDLVCGVERVAFLFMELVRVAF